MFKFLRKSVLLIVCLISSTVIAQETLEQITVTTTKLPQKTSQLTKSMIVLSDSLIKSHSGWSVSDLLQKQVGLNVVGSGQTLGSIQSVFLRGASSGKTLILMDGAPLYDPSSTEGNFDLNLINLQNIERIEILKGGQSTLYGSDAVAGVINFISKKQAPEQVSPYGKLSYGSFNTLDLGVGVRGNLAGFGYNIGLTKIKSDGFSSAVSDLPSDENDGFDKTNFDAQVSKNLGDLKLKAFVRQTNYTADLDAGAFVEDKDYIFESKNFQYGVGADWIKEKYQIHLNINSSKVNREFEDDSTDIPATAFSNYSFSTYESKSSFFDLYSQLFPSENVKVLVGVDYRNQSMAQTYYSVSSYGPFEDVPLLHDDANINNFSAYSAVELSANEKLGIELGGRLNVHSEYKSNFSYSLNPFFRPNENITVYGVWATSYKNPTLYQLYSPYGNLDLKPETSRNIELGLKVNETSFGTTAQLAWFDRKNKNKVTYLSLMDPPYGQYNNIDEQQTSGVEVSLGQKINIVNLTGNYTYLDGFNSMLSKEEQKYNLNRIPKHAINLGASVTLIKKLSLGLDYQFIGERTDGFFDSNLYQTVDVTLDSYSLVDINARYKLTDKWSVFVSETNVFNKDYTEIYGYNSRPASFRFGVNYN